MEVRNRFKGIDLIDECLKNYGWRFMTLYNHRDRIFGTEIQHTWPTPASKEQGDHRIECMT